MTCVPQWVAWQKWQSSRRNSGSSSVWWISVSWNGYWVLLSLRIVMCVSYHFVKAHITKWLHLEDTHTITTPLNPHVILSRDLSPTSNEEKLWTKKIPYLTTIGSIMYAATTTCPNVSFAVQHLSQFNGNPGNIHWTAAQCTIWYLYATRNRTLILGGPEIILTGWVDSDWGACIDSCHSVSGYMFSLGSGLISWSSKKWQLWHPASKQNMLQAAMVQKRPYGFETF